MLFKREQKEKSRGEKTHVELFKEGKNLSSLARFYWLRGEYKKAIPLFRKAAQESESRQSSEFSGNPGVERFLSLAELYEKGANVYDAVRCYYQARDCAVDGSPGYHAEEISGGIARLEEEIRWLQDASTRPVKSFRGYSD
jgi:tetratricopeptide (TPR) repeat protein